VIADGSPTIPLNQRVAQARPGEREIARTTCCGRISTRVTLNDARIA
jgi:hypothetical protein